MKALGFQTVESTSLSKFWFQMFNLHPYSMALRFDTTSGQWLVRLRNGDGKQVSIIGTMADNIPISIYQLLGGFVFICIYYLVFYDQSDDLVESIWVYWRRSLRLKYMLFPPKMIYIEMGLFLLFFVTTPLPPKPSFLELKAFPHTRFRLIKRLFARPSSCTSR